MVHTCETHGETCRAICRIDLIDRAVPVKHNSCPSLFCMRQDVIFFESEVIFLGCA